MKILFRRALRTILKVLCIIAINKHSLEIVAVGGWYGTDIAREAVYTILKQNGKNVRRLVHSQQVDWDIPLTILGIKGVPATPLGWLYELVRTVGRLVILQPVPTMIVLQVNAQDAGIMKYWMSFINPLAVIMLNSHAGTLNLELLLVEKLKKHGLLVLNEDNMRTKSLSQGRQDAVVYFGEYKKESQPDYYYLVNKAAKKGMLAIGHESETYEITKSFPEFAFPFLTAPIAICLFFSIPWKEGCRALDHFELPSEKIHSIFRKFIED